MRLWTPTGLMLEGTYAIGYWCSEAYAGNEEQINNVLNTMLAELESHRLFLARLNESGGASELIIAIFMGEMSGAGVRVGFSSMCPV